MSIKSGSDYSDISAFFGDIPWSYPKLVAEIPEGGFEITLVADADALERMARFSNLDSLERVEADIRLERRGRHNVAATGQVRARGRQICVISLEPFEVVVKEPIDTQFAPAPKTSSGEPSHAKRRDTARVARFSSHGREAFAEPAVSLDAIPDFDPIVDGVIDLGLLATEFLVLALDPYPKMPGARFQRDDDLSEIVPVEPLKISPFAGLAKLSKSMSPQSVGDAMKKTSAGQDDDSSDP